MTRKLTLWVNSSPVEIDYFVQNFLGHTVTGMVSSLEGVMEIRELDISVEEGTISFAIRLWDWFRRLKASLTSGN